MNLRYIVILLFLFLVEGTQAAFLDTLFIVKTPVTYNGTTFKKTLIADSLSQVQYDNAVLSLQTGQVDSIKLINTDTIAYDLYLNTNTSNVWTVGAEDTVTVVFPILSTGTHALLAQNTVGKMLGMSCILKVGISADHIYSWDLWDMNADLSDDIAEENTSTLPGTYRPNVFAINGSPMARMDTSNAIVYGAVGDTIRISVVNTGNMTHNLHFHGFHVVLEQCSLQTNREGWSKDSFPVYEGETMTLLLVPDKPGEYPVHNHNLVTTVFNNNYPKGMMSMMKIAQ